MMYRSGILNSAVDPGLNYFKDKQAVAVYHSCIIHLALQICKTLINKRCLNFCSRLGREAELFKFINACARRVATSHNFFCKFNGGDIDNTFFGRFQKAEGMVAIADDTSYERGFEFHHGVPRLCHNVGMSLVRGRNQDDGPGLQQAIDLG